MSTKRKVLITNADYRTGIAVIRTIGRKGIEVVSASHIARAEGFYSKYCKRKALYTNPDVDLNKFIEDVIDLLKKETIDVVLPVGANTSIPFSYYKNELQNYTRVPVADYDTIVKAHDKSITTRIAAECGVPIPKTFYPENTETVRELVNKLSFPVVIKARKGTGIFKFVYSEEELVNAFIEYERQSHRNSIISYYTAPLIQEFIPRKIHDVCVLFNGGKVRAALTQIRLKTLPPEGGPGVVNMTTNIPELKEIAIHLMEKLNWHGVAQVEFKHDPRDNTFKLLEVNPKFWGTTGLSIAAGMDFPYLLYQMALDGDVEATFDYRVGLKFRWIFPSEINYLRKSPTKMRDTIDFLKFCERYTKTDILLSDIKPNLMQIVSTIYNLISDFRNKLRFR